MVSCASILHYLYPKRDDEEQRLTYLLQQEVSPRTSGRLSHSSGPLNGTQSCGSLTDSPPVSPSEIDDIKVHL